MSPSAPYLTAELVFSRAISEKPSSRGRDLVGIEESFRNKMRKRDRPHIVEPAPLSSEPFTRMSSGGGGDNLAFVGDRVEHGRRIIAEFEQGWTAPAEATVTDGMYLTFVSFPGLELALESLDSTRTGDSPELVAVREVGATDQTILEATVYIPDGKKQYFLDKLTGYDAAADEGKKRNAELIDGIESIRRATIRELWTDPDHQFPRDPNSRHWWEVWLRTRDGLQQRRLTDFAGTHGLQTSEHYLGFADRMVVLVKAAADQLGFLFARLDDLAELRSPHEIASFVPGLPPSEQREWADELGKRTEHASEAARVFCILDRGVQASHPLLAGSLADEDLHTASLRWGHDPVIHPHGTKIAGLALDGNLQGALASSEDIRLEHRLESGRPTSWSASVDALSFGRAIDDLVPKFT